MLFNSLEFLIFLAFTFLLYWFMFTKLRLQNLFILLISYLFYGWWDWRYLGLIAFSSLVDYSVGRRMANSSNSLHKKFFLGISLSTNLGLLAFFKYYNFFIESFIEAFSIFGIQIHYSTLVIILPVGISFYTFQTMSYTIDIYREKIRPCHNIIEFFAFVSFFPQLVAGPIERAGNLLPQFQTKRKFNLQTAAAGLRLILWGMFKKVVIADNCAIFVNQVFDNYDQYNGLTLSLGVTLFAFQIYSDFSGYSDIAIGVGKLLGFELMRNFNYPYFSRDIAEFWRRWHISLSTWFRDYLYIPMGGSRGSKIQITRNIIIVFVVSGLWHGANWTFVIWGLINALYFLPLIITRRNRINLDHVGDGRFLITPSQFLQIVFTFLLTCIGWVFFRSATISDAFLYTANIFVLSEGQMFLPDVTIIVLILFMNVFEWSKRKEAVPFHLSNNSWINMGQYWVITILIILFGNYGKNEFIYFQF